ncbi:MAG: GGDEF domain-containing protein [Planctomycetes bacterium]|nr:GGDEF domain-containing protein [Planctomycetota bacterium]
MTPPTPKETDAGRSLRSVHYRLTFLMAAAVLLIHGAMAFLGFGAVDPLREGTVVSLAFASALGVELERTRGSRASMPKGFLLGLTGLLEAALCVRTGGVSSPYFFLVAGTCVFGGLTLPPVRAGYTAALVLAGYALAVRLTDPHVGGPDEADHVAALSAHVIFAFLATTISARVAKSQRQTVHTLAVQSLRDPLTSLENRRAFLQKLEGELARAERFSWPLTMLVLDLDHFKKLNDVYGHAVGDQVLVETADLLRENVGTLDHVARIGGEEFAIAAVAAEPYHGRDVADRVCRAFRTRPWHRIRPGLSVTVSIGVAVLPPGTHGETATAVIGELMERADRALYRVKQNGRDGYHVSDETVSVSMSSIRGKPLPGTGS